MVIVKLKAEGQPRLLADGQFWGRRRHFLQAPKEGNWGSKGGVERIWGGSVFQGGESFPHRVLDEVGEAGEP
jgi:hypothetical protein